MARRIRTGLLAAVAATALTAVPTEGTTPRNPAARQLGARAGERPRRGRPRKFSRPSRAVTLTLPEDVIASLRAIDTDLSRAVVRVAPPSTPRATEPLEVATYGEHAVIIIPHSRALAERTGVHLVPLSDGRALMAFDRGESVSQLELRLGDALADPSLQSEDRKLFAALADILRRGRQADGIALRERSIIVLALSKSNARGGPKRRSA